jgi:GAF domain-containing protein
MSSEVSTAAADQDLSRLVDELKRELERSTRELVEAREEQAATTWILAAISSSPADLRRVFAEIATSAVRLCDAYDAVIFQVDGDCLRLVAHHGPIPSGAIGQFTLALTREVTLGRAVLDRRTVHVVDLQAETDEYPEGSDRARRFGVRAVLNVPLILADRTIGVIGIRRTEVRLFSDKQIAVLKTFADQAVIAIENTRLFEAEQASKCELQESLEYQTAISEVLSVISRSPNDLNPVLKAIGEIACRLCTAYDVCIFLRRGDKMRLMFMSGPIGGYPIEHDFALTRGYVMGRAVIDARPVHVADLQVETNEFPEGSAIAAELGHRTILAVPLLQADQAIGTIVLRRLEVQLFAPNQVALLKTFADQAVIAIENTRLFEEVQARTGELQEALEQQTATSEVLGVISRSPGELGPVFDIMLANATKLCEGSYGAMWLREGDAFRNAAFHGALAAEYMDQWRSAVLRLGPDIPLARVAQSHRPVQISDMREDQAYLKGHPLAVTVVDVAGVRTMVVVPMLKEDELVGIIAIYRKEARQFTDKQVDLVTNFAKQAVIAIENVRLLNELRESLQQQTATADVLKVISRSALDLQKVLGALVESAARLCNAYDAVIFQVFGDGLRRVAHYGQIATSGPVGQLYPLGRGRMAARAVLDRRTIQIADILAEADEYPETQKSALRHGWRTALCVPLVHAGEAIGVIVIRRTEVRPFTERQIELVNTFADQAVIAIENTRLFEEVQARTRDATEALDYQTATSDVLEAISRSPTDAQPVFETIAQSAARLCNAHFCNVFRFDGHLIHFAASYGASAEFRDEKRTQSPVVPSRGFAAARAILDNAVTEIADLRADPDFDHWRIASVADYRSVLAVPMRKDGLPIGAIAVVRSQIGAFPKRQIELLKTFADQAVIAIENTRLFEAEQASKRELQESLEYQTATSEVLGVISRSPTDAQPVFDAIAESARRLCDGHRSAVYRFDGTLIHHIAHHNWTTEGLEALHRVYPRPPSRETQIAQAILDGTVVHVPDLEAAGVPEQSLTLARALAYRSILSVPMLKDGKSVGAIAIVRVEASPFSERQIELVKTFADQAVIAIENTRLFEEVQARTRDVIEALEYQTATSEVLAVISRSKFDLQPVLDELVASAAKLCQAEIANIWRPSGAEYRLAASYGVASQREDWLAYRKYLAGVAYQPGKGSVVGRTLLEGRTIQIDDIRSDPDYDQRGALAGVRTMLGVPLLRDGRPIGVMVLVRATVRRFTNKQVELIETFADQAVIAIENARLFEEVQARTRELAKTVEDLEIASQHKNQFVANMSHELRTPLAAILGYAELIQEGFYEAQGPKSLDALTRIRSNGKHLLGLINTVLDIAKIESGQFTLNMSEYAIETVVETVRAATESLAQNKKLTLTTSVEKSLPVGLGDEQRLTQVLLNLVGNAIKFTDAGEVSIAAGARNGRFAVSVTDTGPGIPLDQQDRIFEQFHQVDSSMTKAKGGTGLGLAIAKQIVEMHGGRIWVVSTPGKGSAFQMELPTRAEFRKPVQGTLG